MYGLTLITAPTSDPVTLDLAKKFCNVDASFTDDDVLIASFISAATALAESYTSRSFFTQTWKLSLDRFPAFYNYNHNYSNNSPYPYAAFFEGLIIRLPRPTCVSVDSIKYTTDGLTFTVLDPATYYVDLNSVPARIVPLQSWPVLGAFNIPGAVQITFQSASYLPGSSSGSGNFDDGPGNFDDKSGNFDDAGGTVTQVIPANIITAICILTAYFYKYREGGGPDIPSAYYVLLNAHKTVSFGYGY